MNRLWVKYVVGPRYRRRLRDGIIALQELNQLMIKHRLPRQRRRHFIRDLEQHPNNLTWVLDLLYKDAE